VSYGQRTESRERQAFDEIADFYGVEKKLITSIPYLGGIGGSSLTDDSMEIEAGCLSGPGTVPSTYVPFRNAQLMSIAVSWAEVLGAGKVFIGAVEEDGSGYPDCRKIFYDSFNEMVKLGTRPETDIEVVTPLIDMRKSEIIELGQKLGAPFHLTWSCYRREDSACGTCESCLLRLRGFSEAGLEDPLVYVS
jgi:7-cyano-7-deazaguanine synthase